MKSLLKNIKQQFPTTATVFLTIAALLTVIINGFLLIDRSFFTLGISLAAQVFAIVTLLLYLKTKKRKRNIIDNDTELVLIHDINGKCLYASPSVEEMFGYKQNEMIGKSIHDLFKAEELEQLSTHFLHSAHDKCLDDPTKDSLQHAMKNNKNEYIQVETSSKVVGVSNNEDLDTSYKNAVIINGLKRIK